ncbi:hypothetical protein I316_04455 [Kwoniella heveanensis BCC8398]|uniref:Uncharacterized protein n=1 Tax=Kwoniella heveanensis BCC8398 TaxID=1296120 RepID=A0A1B9GRT4_9TREE|nr:hypothetical protein I316_04455 [Kwoniella heveanensis BCC8398]
MCQYLWSSGVILLLCAKHQLAEGSETITLEEIRHNVRLCYQSLVAFIPVWPGAKKLSELLLQVEATATPLQMLPQRDDDREGHTQMNKPSPIGLRPSPSVDRPFFEQGNEAFAPVGSITSQSEWVLPQPLMEPSAPDLGEASLLSSGEGYHSQIPAGSLNIFDVSISDFPPTFPDHDEPPQENLLSATTDPMNSHNPDLNDVLRDLFYGNGIAGEAFWGVFTNVNGAQDQGGGGY